MARVGDIFVVCDRDFVEFRNLSKSDAVKSGRRTSGVGQCPTELIDCQTG